MPTPRSALSTSVVDGNIYAIGGGWDSNQNVSTVEAYDRVTDTWMRKADLQPRDMACLPVWSMGRYTLLGDGTAIGHSRLSKRTKRPLTDGMLDIKKRVFNWTQAVFQKESSYNDKIIIPYSPQKFIISISVA